MKRLIIGAVFWMAPLLAHGEQATGKQPDQVKQNATLEVFGGFQRTGFDAGSIKLGGGNGIDAGFRLFPNSNRRWGVGFRVGRFSHEIQYDHPLPIEGPDAISVDGKGWTVAGDIYCRSRRNRVQPYIFFGLGAISENHTYHFLSGSSLPKKVTTAALDLGLGLKLAVTKRLSFTPEVRVLTSFYYSAIQPGVSITYIVKK